MKTKLKHIILGCLLACAFSNAQDKKEKKAEADFNSHAYSEAIDSYESLVKKGYTSEEIFKNLGNANYRNANYDVAADWYGKLFKLEGTNVEAEYMYTYAQTLKSLKKYTESDQWMQKFEVKQANDNRAIKFVDNLDYLDKIKEQSGRYDIENLPINSSTSDFAPSFNGEELVFSSARDTGRIARTIHEWNNKPFLNLYRSKISNIGAFTDVTALSKTFNKKTHESSTVFTKDGSTVYFTRNNSKKGKFSRDKGGLSRLKIYRATLVNGEWANVIELPFNSDDYSVAHPTLSADEKTLYFASDMPGTLGQSDIFKVQANTDGSYGTPQNLGNKINTEGRETFPFVTESKVLYFASDGHPGLGGLDVFAVKIEDPDHQDIVNIGEPINSEQDDFSFIIDEKTKKGFFASNRDGGQGSDDIYGFLETEPVGFYCTTLVEGTVFDKDNGQPLVGANMVLFNNASEVVAETVSSRDGTFSVETECRNSSYKLVASLDEYDNGQAIFTLDNSYDNSNIQVILEKKIVQAAVGTDLVKFLNLNPVYFDLNLSDIRTESRKTLNAVVEYMNLFPDLKLAVQSHTDTKAGSGYNKKLSEERAKATVAYLIAKGIDENRISGQGFGETQLINECVSREVCDDTQHQLNRRSEFIVLE